MELLQYENAKIFVRKITVNGSDNGQTQGAGSCSRYALSEQKSDPEYQVSGRSSITNPIAQGLPQTVL
jgi:hypothetical protein